MALAFVLAIGSAFTAKKFDNPIGYKLVAGVLHSGPTNNPGCVAQASGVQCTIVISGSPASPVYASENGARNQIAAEIMRH